ncbi:MAG: hypothetical protein FJX68_16865 [Alphaproteobacteria bacterium]|nr:hypothetical protein [Alphaproteobacteria bacterium]
MGHWRTMEPAELTPASLAALYANRLPAIRVSGFASPQECRAFAAAVGRHEMKVVVGERKAAVEAFAAQKIGHLGLTQAEYKLRGVDAYLTASQAAQAQVADVCAHSFDPLARLIDRLQANVPGRVGIASEVDGRPYFCGIIRDSSNGLMLHADFAPYQAPQYAISRIEAQIVCNFYVETPAEAGLTTLYDAPWQWRPSAPGEVAENYPLPEAMVADAPAFSFRPRAGEAWFFNTRNPHRVAPSAADGQSRLAIACFIGRMPSGDLVLWS